jgi:predicted aldo/keto reductase-like oxidoreductase
LINCIYTIIKRLIMEKRKIASLNAELSLLGFGLMRLPTVTGDKNKIDYPKAQAMIDRAYKAGVNYYDTAYVYHNGESEVFAGGTLSKYPRDSYYLATKMPSWDLVKSKDDVKRIFDEQLARCKTSYFDFYLAHSLDQGRMNSLRDNIYSVLRAKKEEGVIRRLGFSFHDHPDVIKGIVKDYEWDFAQIQLNYLDWDTSNAKSLYDTLTRNNIPIVIMEPVKGGTLSSLNEKTLEVFRKADSASSAASWALRFAASLPNVITVLSGMTEPEHVEDNLKTFGAFRPLSDADRKVLDEAVSVYRSSGSIPCTGCRYCMDCPSGVDIPRVFALYNHYLFTKNKFNFGNQYKTMDKSEQAHNCVSCGKCEDLCPQKIGIPKYMKEIADLAT